MNRKIIFPLVLAAFVLFACSCPLSGLPLIGRSATPTIDTTTYNGTPVVTPPPLPAATQAPFSYAWDDRAPFQKNLASADQSVLSGLAGASVYHLAISLADPPTSLKGIEEVLYTNTETVPLSEMDFAVFSEILGGSITINAFSIDGQSLQPTHKNGIMRVTLPAKLAVGSSVTFHIEYTVAIPSQGGNFYYGIFGYNENILSLAHAYPTILVYNEQGWNNQVPDLDGDPLFSDTSLYLVSVNAPANLVLAASGVEIDRTEAEGRQQVLYADGPARDFYLAASADFKKHSVQDAGITINSYTLSADSGYAQSVLNTAKASVDDFSSRYAPYPYSEYDLVPIITSAGGVEFPGIVAIARNVYGSGDFQDVVVIHETGHQWFYNLVGNATQGQPWLDESAAEFVTWQYYLDKYGTAGADRYKAEMQSTWDSDSDKKIPIGEPVPDYSSLDYVAIIYGRGPFFWIALRQQIGVTTFDKFMKDYTTRFSWKIATTDSFKQLAEQDCSCDLTPLFKQWVTP